MAGSRLLIVSNRLPVTAGLTENGFTSILSKLTSPSSERRASKTLRRASSSSDEHNDVDGLRDQRPRYGHDGLLNQLLEARKRTGGRAGVNGRDTARVSGSPGF